MLINAFSMDPELKPSSKITSEIFRLDLLLLGDEPEARLQWLDGLFQSGLNLAEQFSQSAAIGL